MAISEMLSKVEAQHEKLHEMMDTLGAARDLSGILAVLEQLPTFLMKHFAIEESRDGFYDQIGIKGPEYLPEVQLLVAQHHQLIVSVRALLAQARELAEGPQTEAPAELLAGVTALATLLRDHETTETRLIEAAMAKVP